MRTAPGRTPSQGPRPGTGALGLTWLGHASAVLDLGGVRVLTDPLLRRHAGLLRRRGAAPDPTVWAGPDVVLLSHLHHDHAELGSLHLLDDVPVLAAPANAHWLREHEVRGAQGLAEGPWVSVGPRGSHDRGAAPEAGVRVRAVAAVHGDRPMPHRPNAAIGFLVVADGLRVWFPGDTEPYAGMAQLPALAGGPVDLALVPVGGWGPRLSGGHMDPVQAARTCAVVGARHAVPVHWGTLHAPASRRLPPGWMDRAGPAFAAAAEREAPGCRVHVLEPGQRLSLRRPGTR